MKRLYVKLMYKNGKERKMYADKSIRRILSQASLVHFQKAYVRVNYGMKKCIDGCVCEFHNDGFVHNNKDLKSLIQYFWREE